MIGGFVYIGTDQGHLLVLGDPAVGGYALGNTCSDVDYGDQAQCLETGNVPVPNVVPIVDFQVPDGGDLAYLRKEAVLSGDQVFVSTSKGHVYGLATASLSVTVATDQLGPHGGSSFGAVTISRPAPSGGALVALSSSDPVLKIPANVTIPAEGVTSPGFTITDDYLSGPDKSVGITASYNGTSASASLLLVGNGPTCSACGSPKQCCICSGGVWSGRFCE